MYSDVLKRKKKEVSSDANSTSGSGVQVIEASNDDKKNMNVSYLMNDRKRWLKLIDSFLTSSTKMKIETEMEEMISRYNKDELYRQAINELADVEKEKCKLNLILFGWRVFKGIHDNRVRTEVNKRIAILEKTRREKEINANTAEIKSMLEAVNKGRAKTKYEMKRVQDLRNEVVKKYKENMAILDEIERKIKDNNKESIVFYAEMDKVKDDAKERAELEWSKLSDEQRKKEYMDDFILFRTKMVDLAVEEWIGSQRMNPYVIYCMKTHLSGISDDQSEAIEEELQEVIANNNLDFLVKGRLEDLIRNVVAKEM